MEKVEKIYMVMKDGHKIEMLPKKGMNIERWISNSVEFLMANPGFIRLEHEDGSIIKSKE